MTTSYPGTVTDGNSQERIGGTITFTDDANQPGSTLPTVVVWTGPTSDPHAAGQVFADSGVLTVSSG